jgi:hypothetical protein
VDRLSGLRSEEELTVETQGVQIKPSFVGVRLRDRAGRLWQELQLSELASDEAFLKIVG